MNVEHQLISLSDSDYTRILTPTNADVRYSASFTVQNVHSSATVYIGGANVNSGSYGIKLAPNAIASFENVPKTLELFATTDTNGSAIAVLQMSM